MKRVFLAFMVILTLSFTSGAWAAPGDSPNDPIYISTPAQLDAVRNGLNKYYKLSNDIDLTGYLAPGGAGYTKWGAEGWEPLVAIVNNTPSVSFTGGFDGNGHKITGLWIERSDTDYVGLFGRVQNAVIENIGVEIAVRGVIGRDYVGGLVGDQGDNSSIIRSYATGNVSGDSYIGGLVGYLHNDSSISDSYAIGAVCGYGRVGGLVGSQGNNSNIINSYATGNASGSGNNSYYVGGLVGDLYNDSSISDSYATGDVSGDRSIGGLSGGTNFYSSITNSYAMGNVTGSGIYAGGLSGTLYVNCNIINSHASGDVSGKERVGGLVGSQGNNSNIINSYATGNASGSGNNSYYVGGLVGDQYDNSSIVSSYATGDVTGSYFIVGISANAAYTGGLVGRQANSSIANSYATGNVFGINRVGGLVGLQISNSSVTNSYAIGNVTANGFGVGGLVGSQVDNNSITNSYATGNVLGTTRVGGLVGEQTTMYINTITNSYATGNVKGLGIIGILNDASLVGYQQYINSYYIQIIKNSYRYQFATLDDYLPTVDDPNSIYGGIKTAEEFMTKSTYTDNFWLFNDSKPDAGPWYWDERGFPKLNLGTEKFPFQWGTSSDIPVTQVTITPDSASMDVGGTRMLTPNVTPENATDRSVVWSSDNTVVATVNASGEVTAVSAGTATITATSNSNQNVMGTCTVTVSSMPPQVITITNQPAANTTVTAGSITGSLSVTASVSSNGTLTYQWYSNNTNANTLGKLLNGSTSASFNIPATLTAGTYYYYCEVSATGAASVTSNAARVMVEEGSGCNAISHGGYLVFTLIGAIPFIIRKRK